MKFKVMSVFICVSLLCALLNAQKSKNQTTQEKMSISGNWIAISESNETKLIPIENERFIFGLDFWAEEEEDGETRNLTLYDAVWIQEKDQKWSAILYANPDPASSLTKRSDEVICGYVACWIVGDSGVVVFSLDKLDMDTFDFPSLNRQSETHRVYSIFRKSVDIPDRKTIAREYLKQLSPDGPLEDELKRLCGGWEAEILSDK